MRRRSAILSILPALGLLTAGCAGAPAMATYQGPADSDESAAIVAAGTVAESYSVSQNSSWIQIVAVDGEAAGFAPWVRVSPGEHRFTVRHHDPYATFYGNIRHESVSFATEAGGRYRIDASYCCGFLLGRFDVYVIDEASGQEIAERGTGS
jgi:hypothetical protein